ncbi:hypothetical protein [Catenibacterium sp.]
MDESHVIQSASRSIIKTLGFVPGKANLPPTYVQKVQFTTSAYQELQAL